MFGVPSARLAAFSAAIVVVACSTGDESNGMSDSAAMTAMTATPPAASAMADPASYTFVLKSRWTKENHPFEYPAANPISGAHLSGIIGASHDASYSLFAEGTMPTPGLERLSEEGKHDPLDAEIRAAIEAGKAGMLFKTDGLRDFGDSLVATVQVDAAHPLVSLVAMLAPSPDWFTGVADVNLMENGTWVTSRTIELNAYDSGGDDGTTYKGSDRDTNPKKPTSRAATRHFAPTGAAVPVAVLTITKK